MFDLATYPAISLKFIEIQFNDNYEHHESRKYIIKKYIGKKKRKKKKWTS